MYFGFGRSGGLLPSTKKNGNIRSTYISYRQRRFFFVLLIRSIIFALFLFLPHQRRSHIHGQVTTQALLPRPHQHGTCLRFYCEPLLPSSTRIEITPDHAGRQAGRQALSAVDSCSLLFFRKINKKVRPTWDSNPGTFSTIVALDGHHQTTGATGAKWQMLLRQYFVPYLVQIYTSCRTGSYIHANEAFLSSSRNPDGTRPVWQTLTATYQYLLLIILIIAYHSLQFLHVYQVPMSVMPSYLLLRSQRITGEQENTSKRNDLCHME